MTLSLGEGGEVRTTKAALAAFLLPGLDLNQRPHD